MSWSSEPEIHIYRITEIQKYRNSKQQIQKKYRDVQKWKSRGEEQLVDFCTFCPTVSGKAKGTYIHEYRNAEVQKYKNIEIQKF